MFEKSALNGILDTEIGQFPTDGGLFEPTRLPYFRSSQASLTGESEILRSDD
jgi:hypothetical protein